MARTTAAATLASTLVGVGAVALEELGHPGDGVRVGPEVGHGADQGAPELRGRGRRRRVAPPSRGARAPGRRGCAPGPAAPSRASPSSSRSICSSPVEQPPPHRHVALGREPVRQRQEVVRRGGAGQHRGPGVVDQAVALDVGQHALGVARRAPPAAGLRRARGRTRGRPRWRRPTRPAPAGRSSIVLVLEQGGGGHDLAGLQARSAAAAGWPSGVASASSCRYWNRSWPRRSTRAAVARLDADDREAALEDPRVHDPAHGLARWPPRWRPTGRWSRCCRTGGWPCTCGCRRGTPPRRGTARASARRRRPSRR